MQGRYFIKKKKQKINIMGCQDGLAGKVAGHQEYDN